MSSLTHAFFCKTYTEMSFAPVLPPAKNGPFCNQLPKSRIVFKKNKELNFS